MTTLAAALVRQDAASLESIEQAMLRQSLYGGDLATNLLEVGAVDEPLLLSVVGVALGLPAVAPGMLEQCDESIRKLVPGEVAVRHGIYPLGEASGSVVIAVSAPLTTTAVADLRFTLGREVVQRAALEVRIRQAIARDYGTVLESRYLQLGSYLDRQGAGHDSSGDDEPSSQSPTLRASDPPDRPIAEHAAERSLASRAAIVDRTFPSGDGSTLAGRHDARPRRLGPITGPMAESELGSASDPSAVVTAWIDFAAQFFEYVAVFAVQGDLAAGRQARGPGTVGEQFSRIGISLDLPSILRRARLAGTWQLLSLRAEGLDGALARDLARPIGHQALVIPASVRGRPVLLLYGDHGQYDVDLELVGEVLAMTPLVERALERLILQRKLGPSIAPKPARAQSMARKATVPDSDQRASALVGVIDEIAAPKRRESISAGPSAAEKKSEHHESSRSTAASGGAADVTTAAVVALDDRSRRSLTPKMTERRAPQGATDLDRGSANEAVRISAKPGHEIAGPPDSRWEEHNTLSGFAAHSSGTKPGLAPRLQLVEQGTGKAGQVPGYAQVGPTERHSQSTRPAEIDRGVRGRTEEFESTATASTDGERKSLELVGRLIAGDESAIEALCALGDVAASVLVRELPGPVSSPSRWPRGDKNVKASNSGPVLRALVSMGALARPYVIARAADSDSNVRMWATRLLGELPGRQSAIAVSRRIVQDRDPEVRRAAFFAGQMLARDADAAPALRSALLATAGDRALIVTQRLAAIDALCDLRDVEAIPDLVTLLADPNPGTAAAALQALAVLARQDFGFDAAAWIEWWKANSGRHRMEWVIDALDHESPTIRQAAAEELRSLSRIYVGDYDDDSASERQRVKRKYRDWWESTGRASLVPSKL